MKLRNKKTGEIINSGDMYTVMSYDKYLEAYRDGFKDAQKLCCEGMIGYATDILEELNIDEDIKKYGDGE